MQTLNIREMRNVLGQLESLVNASGELIITRHGVINSIKYVLYPCGGQAVKNAKSTKKTLKTKTNWTKLRREQEENTPIAYDEDAPKTTASFWANAEVVMPSHKTHVSMRLDDDIIEYFKKEGRGYQSKINAVLKAYVRSHTQHA